MGSECPEPNVKEAQVWFQVAPDIALVPRVSLLPPGQQEASSFIATYALHADSPHYSSKNTQIALPLSIY